MTDGPYAPPSMSREWKNFARAVRLPAFEEEGASCLKEAVFADARREHVADVASFLKECLREAKPDLFGDGQQAALDAARARFTAPMAQSVLDHCEGALREGEEANEAVDEGVAACLRERARDSSNTIEAYLMLEEGVDIANAARIGCETLLPHTEWRVLAQEIQEGGSAEPVDNAAHNDRLEVGPPLGQR